MANTYDKKGVFHGKKFKNPANKVQDTDDLNTDDLSTDDEEQEEFSEENEELCIHCISTKKEMEEMSLRTLAEMDNFKKRMQREKEEQVKYAAEKVLQDIIPALDNLDLALQYANNDACQDIITGIQMTRKLLLDSLKIHGLVVVSEVNVPFDPEIHEAMGQEASDTLSPNHIVRFLQNGYMLKDRLLRPAKVIVSCE